MIYKIFFQPDQIQTPRRETTKAIYVEASSQKEAITKVEENTEYNIEFVEELDETFLEFEQDQDDFKITEF